MPQQRQYGFSLLTSTALLGLAGTATALGAMPELSRMPDLTAAGPLAVLAAVAWLHQRRERRIAGRLRQLRLTVTLPMPPAHMRDETLLFTPVAPGRWQGQHGTWYVRIEHDTLAGLPWRLSLSRCAEAGDDLPLASAVSLDAVLILARGLLPGMGEAELDSLMDCDIAFPLRHLPGVAETGITALAEGGYALRGTEGCRAIAADLAEILLRRGSTVTATPF